MGGAAAAHANYVKSNPASDAQLTKPPTEVRVTFSETPDARGSDVAVLDTSGKRLDNRDVTLVTDEPNTLRVSLGAIGDGGYLVSWTTVSAVDGHETKGAFAFAINAPLPQFTKDFAPSAPPPTAFEIAGRALSYAGTALLTGLAFFTMFIRIPAEDSERRREIRLVIIGGGALVIGSALLLLNQGANIPQRLLLLLGLRAVAGVAAIALLRVPSRLLPDDARREATAFFGLAAGLTATLVSHAAASGDLRYVALDYLHVIAISIWLGGVVAFSYVVMPSARSGEPRELGRTIWRFSLTALVAVAVIITTGVLQSLDRLVLIEDLWRRRTASRSSRRSCCSSACSYSARSTCSCGDRGCAGASRRARSSGAVSSARPALFAGVLLAAAFLTAFAPPAQANGAAFDETRHVSGIRIELLTATTLPGRNRFAVRVQQGLTPSAARRRSRCASRWSSTTWASRSSSRPSARRASTWPREAPRRCSARGRSR
jgi:copper transport protein